MENNFNSSLEEEFSDEELNTQNGGKFSSADKKGIFLIILLVVVALVMIVTLRSSFGKNQTTDATTVNATVAATQPVSVATTAPQTTFTTAPVSENITTAAPATSVAATNAQTVISTQAEEKESQQPVKDGYTDEEILKAIGDGINTLKAADSSFKAHKTQVISIKLLDCSVPPLTGTINYVLDYFAGEKTADYDVTNGKATDEDGEEITVNHEIPPTDKPFTLTMEGVAEAKAEKTEKGTVYTVKVVPETSTLENPRPPHHNSACDTLDFSAFELPVGEITKCDFTYPGATVSITVDDSGKIVEYRERLEMSGTGEGNALGISGSGTMEGYIDEVWEIDWK